MSNTSFDIIMAGGGVMSCATAYYLQKLDSHLKICIVEKDPTYTYASTTLSDGNTRIQFNLKENIQISQYGLEFLKDFSNEMQVKGKKPDIAFRQEGNLFIVDEATRQAAEEGFVLQQRLGCDVSWKTPDEIEKLYPFCQASAFSGGIFGPQDGTMNPLAVLLAYKNKVVDMGVEFRQAEVHSILRENDRVHGIRLTNDETLSAPIILNGTGAWGTHIAQTCGVELPVLPVLRQVFVVETQVDWNGTLPGIFFPSGLYIFHERKGKFMIGKSFPDDPVGLDFRSNRQLFYNRIWPELVEYFPAFDRLKLASSWSGLYDVNTLDENAILGEWPELQGLFLAIGFSGHGFQQCHAVGRYLAEKMLHIQPSLNLDIFSPQRILSNQPLTENKSRLI